MLPEVDFSDELLCDDDFPDDDEDDELLEPDDELLCDELLLSLLSELSFSTAPSL